MDNSDSLMRLLVGGGGMLFGIYIIRRGSMKIGFGGRSGTASLFTINVTGRGAIFLGVTLLVGGAIFGLSFIFYWLGDLFSSDFFFALPSIGIATVILGIFVSPFLSPNSIDIQYQNRPKHPLIQINETDDEATVAVDESYTVDTNNEEI